MKNKMTQQVDETLQSLDGIGRAAPAAFFYTRLQAKLDHTATGSKYWSWVARPAFSFTTLALLVVLNIFAISTYLKKEPGNTTAAGSGLQHFAQEYDLDGGSVYNDKTNK